MVLTDSQIRKLGVLARHPHRVVNQASGTWRQGVVSDLEKMADHLLGLSRRGRPPASDEEPQINEFLSSSDAELRFQYPCLTHRGFTEQWKHEIPLGQYIELFSGTEYDNFKPIPDLRFHPRPESQIVETDLPTGRRRVRLLQRGRVCQEVWTEGGMPVSQAIVSQEATMATRLPLSNGRLTAERSPEASERRAG